MIYWVLGCVALLGLGGAKAVVDMSDEKSWRRFDSLFKKYGAAYDVDWKWLKAIALNESNLGKYPSVARGIAFPSDIEGSKSDDGLSWGLMQVTIKTAKKLDPSATEEKLNNPDYSVKLSAQLLKELKATFSTMERRYTEWVIKSYNQGPTHTRNEMRGTISNPAWHAHVEEYWARFQRNLKKVEENPT